MGDFARCLGYLAVVGLLSAMGCAGSNAEKQGGGGSAKLPPQVFDTSDVNESVAALSGSSARCQNGLCACREVDGNGRGSAEADVETALRRRLDTSALNCAPDAATTPCITIEGVGTFVKSGPKPEARCIYVDLKPARTAFATTSRCQSDAGRRNPGCASANMAKMEALVSHVRLSLHRRLTALFQRPGKDEFERLTKQSDGKFDPLRIDQSTGMRFSTDREADASVGDFQLAAGPFRLPSLRCVLRPTPPTGSFTYQVAVER